MKVSILIPMYNSEKYIAQTIQSAINQTWPDTEIIIVDDGSTDDSFKIAKSFEENNVKVYQQEKKGSSAARNLAFQYSDGSYIQYLDSDDVLALDKIEKQLAIASDFKYEPELVLTCRTNLFESDVRYFNPVKQVTDKSYFEPIEFLIDLFANLSFMSSHAYLIPRQLIVHSGGWNEKFSTNDDGEFFSRIIIKSKRIVFCNDAVVFYRKIENSLSKGRTPNHVLSEFQTLKKITELIINEEDTKRSREACSRVFNWFIVEWYPENKSLLKEIEILMKHYGLCYFSSTKSKNFKRLKSMLGWRRALLFSEFYSGLKRRIL